MWGGNGFGPDVFGASNQLMQQRTFAIALAAACSLSTFTVTTANAHQLTPFESHSAIFDPPEFRTPVHADDAARPPTSFLGGAGGQSGIAVITEFMKDPAAVVDTRGEWIEIKNNLQWRLNLEGWTITDNAGNAHVINNGGNGLWFFKGERLVLGNNNDMSLNGGVAVDYVWTGFSLTNTTDQIVLLDANGALVDRVDYTSTAPWPTAAGKALALKQNSEAVDLNDDGANWCLSATPLHAGTTDTGTPGSVNDCP